MNRNQTSPQTKEMESSKNFYFKRAYQWKGVQTSFAHYEENQSFYLLKVNVRLLTYLRMKQMEHFFVGLDSFESEALFANQLFIDDYSYQWFRARNSVLPFSSPSHDLNDPSIKQLAERVATLQTALGQPTWTLNHLYTLQGVIRSELTPIQKRIRLVKYKGKRIRTPSAVGSKRFGNSPMKLEELQSETYFSSFIVRRDFLPFLTSPQEDYNLLIGDLSDRKSINIYSILIEYLKERKELPDQFKHFLIYKDVNGK